MDQDMLVMSQIDGGRRLIERLAADGLPITAAFWAKTPDDDRWYMYIASPRVDELGSRPIYPAVRRAINALQVGTGNALEVVPPFTVKLVETTHPMVGEVVAASQRFFPPLDTWHRMTRTKDGELTGTFIYSRLPSPASAPAGG